MMFGLPQTGIEQMPIFFPTYHEGNPVEYRQRKRAL